MKANKTRIFLIVFFIILATAFVTYSFKYLKKPEELPVISGNSGHRIQDFKFVNQLGDTITKADVEGKVLVIEYFFYYLQGHLPQDEREHEQGV